VVSLRRRLAGAARFSVCVDVRVKV